MGTPAAPVFAMAKASTSRATKRRSDDSGNQCEESVETIEYEDGPTAPKVSLLTSGSDLMDNFGGSTKIAKQHLPHNTLFLVVWLKTVEVHGMDQAVYMDAKILMQGVQENDDEEQGNSTPNDDEEPQDERIIVSDFRDHNGHEINDLINAPPRGPLQNRG